MAQTAVITGANRGIGLSLTQLYLARGYTVYALCRHTSTELDQSGAKVVTGVDVSSNHLAEVLIGHFAGVKIDLLINNAGVLKNEVLGSIDYDSIRYQFEVNAIGPLKVTEALANNLVAGAKVAIITSRMGSIKDNTSGGRYGYRMSKAALNNAAMSLCHDLSPAGVSVAILHPGLVGTEMIGGYGDITPDQAAERLAARIDDLTLDSSGTFWHSNGEVLPW